MATLTQVTEQNFEMEILRSELPVLVEFGAEWCGPCKTVAPEVEAIANELAGRVKVVTVDIDKAPLLAREMGIQSVPAFVVFQQGRPVGGRVGAMRRNELRQLLDPVLPRATGAIKPEEAAQLLTQGQVSLIDTREAPVYQRAHLPGAVNIPIEEIENRLAELHMLPSPPLVYCRAGDKTKELAEKLHQQGVPLSFLEGGVLGWEAAGFELERPS
jgi:thioredoxin 1/putative thioredoxin